MTLVCDPGSFRDPSGKVYAIGSRIYRAVFPLGKSAFEAAWQAGILQKMAAQKRMIATTLLAEADLPDKAMEGAIHTLMHPTLPVITYPYEWSFNTLKSAALAHLDLHLALLDEGFTLSDASAFNMQFDGTQPIHIDVLSIIPYRDGMRWNGYRQFLYQFFNPLVLEAKTGISFAPFFQTTLDGISSADLLRLLPWHSLLNPGLLMHVAIPGRGERPAKRSSSPIPSVLATLPKNRFYGLLRHLRQIIETLQRQRIQTAWMGYTATTSYSSDDAKIKQDLVESFIASRRPALLLDIGCNAGHYAELALTAGAQRVVGLDFDRAAIDAAFVFSAKRQLPFTPLAVDIANPPGGVGWRNNERRELNKRIHADTMTALALIHHLAIGKNIPLSDVIEFMVSLAPNGLIEFIPKSDPQLIEMLRFREDIFPDYHVEAARMYLSRHARIVNESRIGDSGRILFQYERNA